VECVAIVGGAHGNEANSVALAQHFQAESELVARSSFETLVAVANPAAVEANRRYVETDLNRCFLAETLSNTEGHSTLEHRRARELNELLGPKRSAEPRADFIIDLHNSTAATGVALMLAPQDAFAHEVASYLMDLDPTVVVVEWTDGKPDYALLPTIGRSGMTFEVGPCPWGCLVGELYAQSRRLILAALDYIEAHNLALQAVPLPSPATLAVPVFKPVGTVGYPVGYPMVHPALQARDFELLHEGDPVFMGLDGETHPDHVPHGTFIHVGARPSLTSIPATDATWVSAGGAQLFSRKGCGLQLPEKWSKEPLFPFFINEAAYYETNVAFSVARRKTRNIEVVTRQQMHVAGTELPKL
jgi:succinylglutamate desuccinylase